MTTLRSTDLTAEEIHLHRWFNVVGEGFEVAIGSARSLAPMPTRDSHIDGGLCVVVDTISQGWQTVESILAIHQELPPIAVETGDAFRDSVFTRVLALQPTC